MKPVRMRSRVRGISLIEVLISMVIGLVVVGAVMVSLIGSGNTGRFQSAYAGMNEDAQIGLSILSRDLQMTGYAQPTALVSNGAPSPTYSLTSTTLGSTTFVFGCDTGFANPTAATLACGTAVTPALEVAYQADTGNTMANAGVPSDCLGNAIAAGPPYVARNRYFISTGASGRPELYCASNNAANAAQPLIENIENMKIWYGVSVPAAPTQVVRYVTATQIAALGAGAAAEWSQVISARICVLARSAEPVLNTTEDPIAYLNCDSVSANSNDRYLRRAYFTTASVRVRMPL
jgi:type IV pilus assembly protein PilW